MPFIPLATSEVDAKSPIDDNLMGKIKANFDFFNSQFTSGSIFLSWKLGLPLRRLYGYKRSVGLCETTQEFTPSSCRVSLQKSGLSGVLALDIRKITQTKTPIIGIRHQLDIATQSIANIAPALTTQSISRIATQISTQSISVAKATISIQSIIQVPGTNLWRYNLASSPDSDWIVGKSVLISSATAGGNNGTFPILERNQSGHPSIVVSNPSGVAQTGAAGTIQLQLFSYNFTNPVDAQFVSGESALFASHTTPANNGTIEIYKTNQSGSNIWIFNSTGAAQAGVAGVVDVQRFRYAFSSTPSNTDFIVGERIKAATHTTPANNGNFPIVAVNASSIDVYNAAGVVQGGVAGTVNTNRWIYGLGVDPSGDISVNDNLQLEGHTTPANNGEFPLKEINRSASNNLVIYNEDGVAQGGAAGNSRSSRKVLSFSSDQSLVYQPGNFIEILDTQSPLYIAITGRAPYKILQVNRGGGANYNVVFENHGAPLQSNPSGFVSVKMVSIFVTTPSMAVDLTANAANEYCFSEFTDFVNTPIPENTIIGLFVTSVQLGNAEDLTVNLQ